MKMSKLIGKRYKEQPSEASIKSHIFMLRGGYIRQVANGIYSLLPVGLRSIRKIEKIIREEMNQIGGQEVLLPVAMPKELWEESERYSTIGKELIRFKDRTNHDMVLGMTHEEAVVHLCRSEITSYKQLPFMVYQIQTKFRDELRSRAGLIRVREFTMKDAYSFHSSQRDLETFYEKCLTAYKKIFDRVGIPETVVVKSDTGMMGGKMAHEFMLLCDAGEDTIVTCSECHNYENIEVSTSKVESYVEPMNEMKIVETPNCTDIESLVDFFKIPAHKILKSVFYQPDIEGKIVLALIRGDIEINETKLSKIIQAEPILAENESINRIGAVPGYASPFGINSKLCTIIADHSVAVTNNMICGANKKGFHYTNFNLKRDIQNIETYDIALTRESDKCSNCNKPLKFSRGIEVGNIFQLGTKYSNSMGMRYLDDNGVEKTPIMGCYGIGIGRLLSSVMEVNCDEYGPIWPISISPWHVHINMLQPKDNSVRIAAETLYEKLNQDNIETIIDDRFERPGVKFAEADLLGVPIRINVGTKNLNNGNIEIILRGNRKGDLVLVNDVHSYVKTMVLKAFDDLDR